MIIKRNKSKEEFSTEKIEKALLSAFISCGYPNNKYTKQRCRKFAKSILPQQVETVEDVQDKIEDLLMSEHFYDVAKAYIIYREKHKNIRNYADNKISFINRYKNSDNTANATVDDNSNVSNHNIAVLNSEIHKEENAEVNLRIWELKLQELYPDFNYKQMKQDFNTIAYPHDLNSQIGMPYTYSSKEVVEVMYNSHKLLVPLDLLYTIVEADEVLINKEKEVYQKTPWNLYIKDYEDKWTKVTKLTKKKRHRPLVRVKTAFGEDIVVTDNHPMIIDALNIENTIEAKDSLGYKQYRVGTNISFLNKTTLDMVSILPTWVSYENNFIKYQQSVLKRHISLNRDLGYIIGFFVGDGGYNNTGKFLDFYQKEKEVLVDINSKIYSVFGIAGTISKSTGNSEKYVLSLKNQYVFELFKGYFKIQDKAQNKTLPYNILEFNEEFAKGCLEGLIDSDGTIKEEDCIINIRLSSRACILQCTYLFRYFGYSVGNGIQSLPFSNNTSYKQNYTIWGISATKREDSIELNNSFKVKDRLITSKYKNLKYKHIGYCNITNVTEVEEESSFYLQNEFIYDITTETHTFCSNNLLVHNCVAITMYPFYLNGIKDIGGLSVSPKNIDSFCGMFVNLIFAIAAQYKGAVATPGLFVGLDWFLRKEYGDTYYKDKDYIISSNHTTRKQTIHKQIHQYFQQICYSLMQPSGSRGNQAVFWNCSIFDKPFFDTMYGKFYYPDGSKAKWESINWLQKDFLHWLNQERLKCILTFPVVSACLIYQDNKFLDNELYEFLCDEYSQGNSFFTYISDSADSLSSCCRLSSKIEKPQFNFTNGQLSEMTGSKNVITLNLNRIIQDYFRPCKHEEVVKKEYWNDSVHRLEFVRYLTSILERIYKYQTAYNEILKDLYNANLLTVYKAGFIDMKKQYLTIGLNGLNQAAEFLGIKCNKNKNYEEFCNLIFSTIKEQNQKHKTKELMFNTEFTPCESAAIKMYNRDKKDGYWVPTDTNLYASYIYKPNDASISILDKIYLHGRNFCGDWLDGGSSAHLNLDTHLSKEQYKKLLKYAAEVGCKYFTFNVPNSECDDCGYITKVPINKCPKCGSEHISYYDRVIGYLTKISNWSEGRQIEQKTRVYNKFQE